MKKLITFSDGSYLAFDKGKIDEFRVSFYDETDNLSHSPKDTEFLWFFKKLAEKGNNPREVFDELLAIAKQINKDTEISTVVLPHHAKDKSQIRYYYALIAAMIAEENKEIHIVGKRVKLLGLHQVLLQDMHPKIAAKWSVGMPWKDIDKECKKWGF